MEWLVGLLPFALIAIACPLIMLFMMRGMHGGQGEHEGHQPATRGDISGNSETELRLLRDEVATLRRQIGTAAPNDTLPRQESEELSWNSPSSPTKQR